MLIKFWEDLWKKISWAEVIIICIIVIVFMTFIKVNVATYHVECNNGSIEEIKHGTNYVCDSIVEFNAYTGRAREIPPLRKFELNIFEND